MRNDMLDIVMTLLGIILVRTCGSLVGNCQLSKRKQNVKGTK